jgi:hypothetical protein
MFQFAHIDSYSRVTPKVGKTGAHSVHSIVAEASRVSGSVPHIQNPQSPVHLYGAPLEDLEAACDTWASTIKDTRGHKLRKDALCLLAGVISARAGIESETWNKIKEDSITWLRKKYGDRLKTVVEHVDENNPHIHFYCIPLAGERFDQIHDGKREVAAFKGRTKGQQNAAYQQAMRKWQDEFSADVGVPNGMSRFGPRKRRLSRAAWKQEQRAHEHIASSLAASEKVKEGIEARAAEVLRSATLQAGVIKRDAREEVEINVLREFGKKNILAKVIEMITKLSKENARLRGKAQAGERNLEEMKASAVAYRDRAKGYFDIIKTVRPKYQELLGVVGHLKIINRALSADLESERENHSSAENRLSKALQVITDLQAEHELLGREGLEDNSELAVTTKRRNDIDLDFRR